MAIETALPHLDEAQVAARFEDLAHRYHDEFAGPISNLRKFLPEDHQERGKLRLGRGGRSEVYSVTTSTGTHAVRLPLVPEGAYREQITHAQTEGLVRGWGVQGLEQIEAVSKEEGVIVSELVSGHDGKHLTKEDIASITDDHFSAYVGTALIMQDRGLKLDANNHGNFMYSPESGFTIIDYELGESTLTDKIVAMAELLRAGSLTSALLAEDPAVFAARAADSLGRKELLIRFSRVCTQRLAGHPEVDTIEREIQRRVESAQNYADVDSNPEYVARQIASNARARAARSRIVTSGGRILIALDD